MPRPPVTERARMYLAKCAPSISGSGGHNAAFTAACALVKGFDLSPHEALPLLAEWNRGCQPPWSERELAYKVNQADKVPDDEPRGWLLGDERDPAGSTAAGTDRRPASGGYQPEPKPEFDEAKLRRFAKGWEDVVDLVWLANRSALDPATLTADGFLRALYGPREAVVVFTNQHDQGAALWPRDELPQPLQPRGAWFLAQPVDGEYHPNDDGKMSRRSRQSVTAFRYLVIESDEAPVRLWLGALVQLPLRIAAIYSSGGRSVHALVRVDAPTKGAWDDEKARLAPGLAVLGADLKAMTAVRLTRLPGYYRGEKARGGGPAPLQKLLYVQPNPPVRPLMELPVLRDVEKTWCDVAAAGVADTDETGGAVTKAALSYYANVSARCNQAWRDFEGLTLAMVQQQVTNFEERMPV